jgi:class 3 adenylate cyclase
MPPFGCIGDRTPGGRMSSAMDQGNRTFIGSVVFVDIVGYSKKSVSDQITMKDRFTGLLSESLKDIAAEQRIILDTGDGAALSFIGDPEDALFVGMNMRDMLKNLAPDAAEPTDESTSSSSDLFLRIGINLGPIKLVRDINGQPNIVGDGINVAQRIMSFARPGQVVVSRSYYDVVSVISDEYAQLFKYEGSRTDKHVREHEIYVVGDSAAAFNKAKSGMEDRAAATNPRNKVNAEVAKKAAKSAARSAANAAAIANGEPIPLMQDKKKLGMIGGALGAVVLVLAAMVAMKKPAGVDPTKTDVIAASTTPTTTAPTDTTNAAPPAVAKTPDAADTPAAANNAMTTPTAGAPTPTTTQSTPVAAAAVAAAAGVAATPAPAKTDTPRPATKTDAPKVDSTRADPTKAVAQGTINFSISPWGEILINGKSIGTSPPVKQHKLAPGKYRVEVRNSTLTPFITTIDVKSKEDITVRHQFK